MYKILGWVALVLMVLSMIIGLWVNTSWFYLIKNGGWITIPQKRDTYGIKVG